MDLPNTRIALFHQPPPPSMSCRMQRGISLHEGANSAGPISQLPEDVVVEILAKLPVKSLIRFKCVCKSWLCLIGSVYLATKQLAMGRDDGIHGKLDCFLSNFSTRFDGGLEFSLDSLDTLHGRYSSRRFKITGLGIQLSRWRFVGVAEPLDGILCIKVPAAMAEVFVLWNPSTGEAKPIPLLTKCIEFFGLGRDNRTGEYKILAISIHTSGNAWEGDIFHITFKAEMYSLGSSSWRVLDVSHFFDGSRFIDGTHMNGLVHNTTSMVLSADGGMLSMLGTGFSVFSFDLSDEIYIQTPPPPPWESPDYYRYGDRLLRYCPHHGATCTLFFLPYNYNRVRSMEIWVLIGCGPRGSWTKQISLDYNLHPPSRVAKETFYYRPSVYRPSVHYKPWVYYRPSLVSISQIFVNEDDDFCTESDLHISIYEEYFSSDRTLFTLQLPRMLLVGMQTEG
ncbi:hypothetical protein Dimus_035174 [Dionaea muscipula]